MKKLHIFTSAACNYIPKVRMLFQSLRQHHPDAVLHLALADELTSELDLANEPFDEVTSIAQLDIPEWKGWAFCHSIVELATAIKPFFLARLLERDDCGQVIYLDPDMVVFSPLDDIVASLQEANLVLTPHQIEPEETLAAIIDNEICSLKHGIYNLGFIGVANTDEGKRFAAWWSSRLYHFCRSELHNGLFTDQRWIDLVPAMFDDVGIVRSSRHNVATWNLTTREMTRNEAGEFFVDGEPLGFYHFTGFDNGSHRIMAARNAPGNEAVQALVNWYESSTRNLSQDPLSKIPWAYGKYTNGQPIERVHRFIYRERADLQQAFDNPFDADTSSNFCDWVKRQGPKELPVLFAKTGVELAMLDMSRNITPGFARYMAATPPSRPGVAALLRQAIRKPSLGAAMARHAVRVLRREGYRGIKRRVLGSGSCT